MNEEQNPCRPELWSVLGDEIVVALIRVAASALLLLALLIFRHA